MKRFFVLLLTLILLLSISKSEVFAVDTEDVYKESGAEELEKNSEDTGTNLWQRVIDILSLSLTGGANKALKHVGTILACILLLSLLGSVNAVKEQDMGGTAYEFVGASVLAAACFPALYSVFSYTKAAVESMHGFCLALLPVTTSLYSMGGNPSQGVTAGGGMSLFLTLTETVSAKLLLPLLSVGFAFALIGLLPGAENISPFGGFVKNTATTLIVFSFSLVAFVFYCQTAVSAAADGMGFKVIKFASGSFIPLIGNAVGDSARTVFSAVSTVKASVGALGISVVLGYLLPPFVSALVYKGCFSFCAVFARLCGLEKQAKFIGELGSLLGISLALLTSVLVVFIVISAVFLKSGVAV